MISPEMILLGATILIVIGGWTRMLRGNVRGLIVCVYLKPYVSSEEENSGGSIAS